VNFHLLRRHIQNPPRLPQSILGVLLDLLLRQHRPRLFFPVGSPIIRRIADDQHALSQVLKLPIFRINTGCQMQIGKRLDPSQFHAQLPPPALLAAFPGAS